MKGFCLEVYGPYACFTRPEMKVERVSYDVITPSAARAIFEAILWKPSIRWRITKIEVLEPVKWLGIRRNEVGRVASLRSEPILIEEDRQQRAGLILRDVRYRLHAEFDLISSRQINRDSAASKSALENSEDNELADSNDRINESPAKYASMFERRVQKGQCFHTPYLGTREFACSFRLAAPGSHVNPIEDTRDLGWMLFDMDFSMAGKPIPLFYRPHMKSGVIVVPHPDSQEVMR